MCNVTLKQAKQAQLIMYKERIAWAKKEQSRRTDLEAGLSPAHGLPVKVYEVPASALNGVLPNGISVQANAVPTKRYGRYVIFLSQQILRDPDWPSSLHGDLEKRFVVLHEYRHILERDVFEDDPETAFRRRCGLDQSYSKADAEDRADGYAAHRMIKEATGDTVLISGLKTFIAKRGLSNP